MSALPMYRQCIHCHRSYHYNPSIGDMGTSCKYCRKSQYNELSIPALQTKSSRK